MIGYVFLFVAAIFGILVAYSEEISKWCDRKQKGSPRGGNKQEDDEPSSEYTNSKLESLLEPETIAPLFREEYERLELEFETLKLLIRMRRDACLTYDDAIMRMGGLGSEISSFEKDGGDLTIKALNEYARVCGYKLEVQYSNI